MQKQHTLDFFLAEKKVNYPVRPSLSLSCSSHSAQVKQGLPTLATVLLSITVKGLVLSKCLNYTALPLVCMMCMWIIYSSSLEEEDVEDARDCEAECCDILQDVPYRPKSFSESKKKQGKQSRTFQKSWLAENNWLTYCTTRNTVFCFYCRKVNLQGGLTFCKRSDDAFTC